MASKAIYPVVAVLGIALASAGGWWLLNRQHGPHEVQGPAGSAQAAVPAASAGAGTTNVEVTQVLAARLQDDAQAVGTVRSRQSVMLRPEVAGRVMRLGFSDGARVKRGQVLVQLDDTLQQAEVAQATAQASTAQTNYNRNQELVAQNFVSQRVLDESGSALRVAQAQVTLAKARLQRMAITAPFDGTVGIRTVNVGDFVRDGADLVNLEDIATLYVDFRLPERFQTRLQRGQTAELQLDALPGRRFQARIEAIDPLLDVNGRSVAVRAVLANNAGQATAPNAPPLADGAPLRPGMFARVTVVFAVNEHALAVPEEAIVPQNGKQYVVKVVSPPAGAASAPVSKRQEVQLGMRREGRVEIAQGVQPGDLVVVAGQQRLQTDGTPVKIIQVGDKPAASAPAPAQ